MNERELPDLRILPTETLVLHEETDPERTTRLTQVLAREQKLKNPAIVAPIPDSERYVVLDGANRTMALRALGAPHMLVQVVNYDEVELDTWNHVITGMATEALFASVRAVQWLDLQPGTLILARALLTARRCLGYLIDPSGAVSILRGGASLRDEARLLMKVVAGYKGISTIYRTKTDNMAELIEYYEHVAAIVVFPRFTPADIINLATTDDKMPTGITRHIIPHRALRLNYDIQRLADPAQSLAEKNEELQGFIRERLQGRNIRFYQESTVLFDE